MLECATNILLTITLFAVHMQTHKQENLLLCQVDGEHEAVLESHTLVKHAKNHDNKQVLLEDIPVLCSDVIEQKKPNTTDLSNQKRVISTDNSLLFDNKQTHSEERTFKCDVSDCGKTFGDRSNLFHHKQTHKGNKPFKCDFGNCEKVFGHRSNLTVHKRTHTGKKCFKCDIASCEKAFCDQSNLIKHKRIHTGRKLFKCDVASCEKTFATNGNLTKHKRTHPKALLTL